MSTALAKLAGALDAGSDWDGVLSRLGDLRLQALREAVDDRGALTSFVSAVNLMTDCVRGTVDTTEVGEAVAAMDVAGGWESAFRASGRRGEPLMLPREEAPAFTVMRWQTFLDVFAERLGVLRPDRQDVENLWRDLLGGLQLPLEDVGLADTSRSTWISDDRRNGELFRGGDLKRDVYDALGLDWSERPADGYSADGTSRMRVVLLSCPLHERHHVAGSLHCTTTRDGWGELLYVPRQPTGRVWPEHGSATAGPASDHPQMPEAVHGPAPTPGRFVWAHGIGMVEIGNRARECGDAVSLRAMNRLEAALAGLREGR